MTTQLEPRPRTALPLSRTTHGAAAATGPAFVVLVLAGNSLTESLVKGDTLADLAAQAGSTAARAGVMMELLAFVAFALFAGYLVDALRRRDAFTTAGAVAVVGIVMMLSVKLGSAAPYLVALSEHASITAEDAALLLQTNGAAFVLVWLPFSLFVGAAATALRAAALIGRPAHLVGLGLAGLGMVAALAGAPDPEAALPVPFLLSLLWTLAIGSKLALGEWRRPPA
jgi:predicted metal-binding membrane protein